MVLANFFVLLIFIESSSAKILDLKKGKTNHKLFGQMSFETYLIVPMNQLSDALVLAYPIEGSPLSLWIGVPCFVWKHTCNNTLITVWYRLDFSQKDLRKQCRYGIDDRATYYGLQNIR